MPEHAAAVPAPVPVTDDTRIGFRPLSMRQDGESWVIGRVDTGDFAVVPDLAQRAITLLGAGRSVGEVARLLTQETGTSADVAGLARSLDGLGFIAAIDGRDRPGPAPVQPSLPWLRPSHVRWLLHPAVAWLVLAAVTAAAIMMIARPGLLPQYRDLVWSRHSGLVLAVNAALGWCLVWLHELGHLAAARAAGVPARMSLTTRLQFLAAQTDVSGIWAAGRRARVTVYLAGIVVNLLAAAACVFVLGLADPGGLARQLLSLTVLLSVLEVPLQLLIFMRTDVYFLVQDLAGCANLYAEGTAHLRYLARRTWHVIRPGDVHAAPPPDPAAGLPRRQRRAVRAYSWLLLSGTTAAIAAALIITIPATVAIIAHAVSELAGAQPVSQADGAAALIALTGTQVLWVRSWWRRHRVHLATWLRPGHRQPAGRR